MGYNHNGLVWLVVSVLSGLVSCHHRPVRETKATAVQRYADLRKEAQTARKAGDGPRTIRAALEIRRLLHDAPNAVEYTAKLYWANKDTQNALGMLKLFAELGQADTGIINGSIKGLQALPECRVIIDRFAANQTAISVAKPVFALTDPNLLPEDIDYDPKTRSFLITSVLEKKIIRLSEDGHQTDFAKAPSGWPMFAIKIDTNRNLVWASEVAVNGFTAVAKREWGRCAVLCFDLRTGALIKRIEAPLNEALGDFALTPDGDPIVSDGDGGGIYRIANDRLELINDADFISPQTPVVLPDGEHVLIPDYLRGIGILSLRSKEVSWLGADSGIKVALNGVDGLYFDRGMLMLTQNGTSPERVMALQLDKSYSRVRAVQIIERGTVTLGDPTHGVFVGGVFYYIANSGWDQLDDHGDATPGGRLAPAKIMRCQSLNNQPM